MGKGEVRINPYPFIDTDEVSAEQDKTILKHPLRSTNFLNFSNRNQLWYKTGKKTSGHLKEI